jgi:hypothetical protein
LQLGLDVSLLLLGEVVQICVGHDGDDKVVQDDLRELHKRSGNFVARDHPVYRVTQIHSAATVRASGLGSYKHM